MNLKKYSHLTQVLFIGQSYFNKDGAQLCLIFQPLYCTLKRLYDTGKVVSWKYEGLPAEKLTTPTTADNGLSSSIKLYVQKLKLLFDI